MKKIGFCVVGATGYGAGEILRIATAHSQMELVSLVSRSAAGQNISNLHPHLEGFYDGRFEGQIDWQKLNQYSNKVIFLAMPHGESAKTLAKLLEEDSSGETKFIDLSGDLRIKDSKLHTEAYPEVGLYEDIREQAVYGLTEINRKQIAGARIISNPGCYPTASLLASLPLVSSGLVDRLVIDAKSGTSGAGKSPKPVTNHSQRNSSMTAYNVLQHRHEKEISNHLTISTEQDVSTLFVPQLLPVSRGIFLTLYANLADDIPVELLVESYQKFYSGAKFVRARNTGVELSGVVGSNFFDYQVHVRGRDVVVVAAIDNMVKGMAGQAIQNMNLMFDLPEVAGIWTPSIGLV